MANAIDCTIKLYCLGKDGQSIKVNWEDSYFKDFHKLVKDASYLGSGYCLGKGVYDVLGRYAFHGNLEFVETKAFVQKLHELSQEHHLEIDILRIVSVENPLDSIQFGVFDFYLNKSNYTYEIVGEVDFSYPRFLDTFYQRCSGISLNDDGYEHAIGDVGREILMEGEAMDVVLNNRINNLVR